MIGRATAILRRGSTSECGNAAVEFAFIGALLISLTLGIFEAGRAAYTHHRLKNATMHIAREIEMGTLDPDNVRGVIQQHFPQSEHLLIKVSFKRTVSGGVTYHHYLPEYTLKLIIPGFGLLGPENTLAIRTHVVVPMN
jgi:hypothetical protein